MKVKGRVQLSTYRMRSRELQMGSDFVAHIKSLPLQYERGIYFAFLEDYGTHYTRNGKSGGEYELVYVLDQDTIREKSMCSLSNYSSWGRILKHFRKPSAMKVFQLCSLPFFFRNN